jgi:Arylsulfatase A and related enzymes
MMTGQLASRIGVYDNAAELPSTIPTFAHYLRLAGLSDLPLGQDGFQRRRPTPRL